MEKLAITNGHTRFFGTTTAASVASQSKRLRCDLGYIWYFYIDYCASPPRLFTFALLNGHGDALHVVAILKANELSVIPMQAPLHMF